MAANLKTKLSIAISSQKYSYFNLGLTEVFLFDWSWFPCVQLIIIPHWFRSWLEPWGRTGDKPLSELISLLTHIWVTWLCKITHDDVIKWKHFLRNWPFVRGINWSPVNSPHKGQWCRAWMFSLICVWINDWVNNRDAGDLRRYRAHYDVIVMWWRNVLEEKMSMP